MARKFLTAIDLNRNELQNAVVQNLASAPSAPVEGQLYMDTTTDKLFWYNGVGWIAAEPGAGATLATTVTTQAVGDASVVGASTNVARQDHKHGMPAFGTVTTTPTTFGAAKADGVGLAIARADHHHGTPTHDAAAHSTIPVSAHAAATASIDMGGQQIVNLGTPSAGSVAANKQYVDNAINGLGWKDAVRLASTANHTLTGPATVDGVNPANGERVLLKNQTTAAQNGIYVVNTGGAWTRALDADSEAEILSTAVFVSEGSTLADTAWVCTTNAPITVGTTSLAYVQFASATGSVPLTRTITTSAPLSGGGALSANLTLDISYATTTLDGSVTLATLAETSAKTDTAKVVTPSGLAEFPKKYRTLIGDGSSTSINFNHGLGTQDIVIALYEAASPFREVECEVVHASTSTVILVFTTPPAANQYVLVVVG